MPLLSSSPENIKLGSEELDKLSLNNSPRSMSSLWPLQGEEGSFFVTPLDGMLNFNVDGVARDKPKAASIGGVLRKNKWEVMF